MVAEMIPLQRAHFKSESRCLLDSGGTAEYIGTTVMKSITTLFLAIGFLVVSFPAAAHHSFAAQYDRTKSITLKGTVTKVEWMNPHIYFYIDVKDDADRTINWAVEGGAPSMLYRNGWRIDSLKVGDKVTVDGWLAKDGSNLANMRTATLADGKTVFGASSGGDTR
jgi:hypothetical protein